MRLLVAEDEPTLAAALCDALSAAGHAVDRVADGVEAETMLGGVAYDLVLLDIGLPRLSGLEVCRRARQAGVSAPVLMLTARDTLGDKVEGLDAGADDYMVKPFELAELHARVRALLRRHSGAREAVLRVGELALDPAQGLAWRSDRPLALARKELALLELFMRHPGQLLGRERILAHLWNGEADHESDVVRAHVKLLRRAIGQGGAGGPIQTVHGLGYRLAP